MPIATVVAQPATPAVSNSATDDPRTPDEATPSVRDSTPTTPDEEPRYRTSYIAVTAAAAWTLAVAWVSLIPPSFDSDLVILGVTLTVAVLVGVRTPLSFLGGAIIVSGEAIPLIACSLIAPQIAVPIAALSVYLVPGSRSVRILGGSQVLLGTIAASAVALYGFGLPNVAPSSYISAATGVMLTFLLTMLALVASYEGFVWRTPLRNLVLVAFGSVIATSVFALPILCAAAYAIHVAGTIALPLLMLPLALTQYFHGLYHRKVELTSELAEKAQILARTNLQFAAAMVRALDTRDAYTAGHSAAVAVYTRDIAREMGFDDETVRLAHLAGLLHDIGKIGVPGRVLNKQSPLDDEEYELMKTHAAMGAEILGEVDLYKDIAILVRYHHERIDGRGYPDKLEGEAIPAISRMISVADTYSAMTTDRPYRDGMPTEKAMGILRECRGTQLDSDFTDAFLRILIVADEAYQRGKQTDFEVEVAKHQALSEVEAEAVRIDAPTPVGPQAPAAPAVPMLPAAVDGELVEVDLEREAA